MKSAYLVVICTTIAHPNQGTITKLRSEKSVHEHAFLILNLSTFRLTLSFVPTNKWYLSALLFKRLFLNHSKKPFDACSRDVIRSSTLSAIMYGILSSTDLAMSISFTVKNKSAKKTLNNSGPSIEPCRIPNIISNQEL